MRIESGRTKALNSLLGTEHPSQPANYPNSVILPTYVHQRTLEAIEQTSQDTRERSINFSFKRDKWIGSRALKGSALKIEENGSWGASISYTSILISIIHRPHLFMHTHPVLTEEIATEITKRRARAGGWDNEAYARTQRRMPVYLKEAVEPLPSIGDVVSVVSYPQAGTVANLIGSQEGLFMYVAKNENAGFLESLGEWFRHKYDPEVIQNSIKATKQKAINETLPGRARQLMISTIVDIMEPKFVCYFSDDPENSTLAKVDVADSSNGSQTSC